MAENNNGVEKDVNHINFRYIKSNHFRVTHADGVWGGLTPQFNLYIAPYNERQPMPDQVSHSITSEGRLGEEIVANRIASEAIIRELETGIVMTLPVAKALASWIMQLVDQVEKAQQTEGE